MRSGLYPLVLETWYHGPLALRREFDAAVYESTAFKEIAGNPKETRIGVRLLPDHT